MKKLVVLLVAALFGLGVFGLVSQRGNSGQSETHSQAIKVIATFYPLQQLALPVVGDRGTVTVIVPSGMEPHDYEPSLSDIRNIYDADLFLLNGAGIDVWAEKLIPDLEAKGVRVLRLADTVTLLSSQEAEHEHAQEELEDGEKAEHEHGEWDPHFWLDPILAQLEVSAITESLIHQFPENQDYFSTNRDQFLSVLAGVHSEYQQGLARCQKKEVVTSHDAFRYLAARYGFMTHALAGLSPEEEPSPKRMADLANEVWAEGIQYIFFETLVSPKIAETLAYETGVSTLVFNPIEGITEGEAVNGVDYVALMRSNLVALRKALQCE